MEKINYTVTMSDDTAFDARSNYIPSTAIDTTYDGEDDNGNPIWIYTVDAKYASRFEEYCRESEVVVAWSQI